MNQELIKIRNSIREKRHSFKSKPKENNWLPKVVSKFLITVVLTLITLIVLKINPSLKEKFYTVVYENNFSFATINKLYNDWFGDILPFGKDKTNNEMVFDEKLVYEEISDYHDGAKLKVANNYLMPVLESGLVLFVGTKDDYNTCAIVQGSDGIEVWYCNVTNLNVKLYDYVEKGTLLGEITDNTLYLVYKKSGEVLDYQNYIK